MRHGTAVVFLENFLGKFELITDLEVDNLYREIEVTGMWSDQEGNGMLVMD